MKNAVVGTLAGVVVVAGIIYFLNQRKTVKTEAGATGVTTTNKSGVVTTPIKTSAVAAVEFPLADLLKRGADFVRTKLSSVVQHSGQDVMQPYGSAQVATAAAAAPLRPEYKPSSLARGNIVYLQ